MQKVEVLTDEVSGEPGSGADEVELRTFLVGSFDPVEVGQIAVDSPLGMTSFVSHSPGIFLFINGFADNRGLVGDLKSGRRLAWARRFQPNPRYTASRGRLVF